MPSAGRDTSAFRVVLAIFGVWLLWQLRDVALLLFGAIIVAALLRAFSDPLSRGSRLPSRPAVLTVALGLLAILVLIVWSLGEPLAHQLQELRTALPKAWASVREWLERCAAGVPAKKSPQPFLFPAFPGFGADTSFAAKLLFGDKLERTIHEREVINLARHGRARLVDQAVELFLAEAATKLATDRISPVLSFPANDGMPPPPFETWRTTAS